MNVSVQRVMVTFNAGLNNRKSFDARILVNEPSQDLAGVAALLAPCLVCGNCNLGSVSQDSLVRERKATLGLHVQSSSAYQKPGRCTACCYVVMWGLLQC